MAGKLECEEDTDNTFDDGDLGFDETDAFYDYADADADDLGCDEKNDEVWVPHSWPHKITQNHIQQQQQLQLKHHPTSSVVVGLPLLTEKIIQEMMEKERDHLPKDDYLNRLRSGDLDISKRRHAIDWIWMARAHFGFGDLTFCLAMIYFDRFLSVYKFASEEAWNAQLLSVACISLAAKMEETDMPLPVELQEVGAKFTFSAKAIHMMELVISNTLNWRMLSFTPFSFIDYFLAKINGDQIPSNTSIYEALQVIVTTVKGIEFLEFKPSEIAAAVAISMSANMQAEDFDKALGSLIHLEKGRVMKCVELIKNSSLMNGGANVEKNASTSTSCASSSPRSTITNASSSNIKRRKQEERDNYLEF